MKYPVTWSQRLLRKGPFPEETYRLFAEWRFDQNANSNLDRLFEGMFKTVAWEKEVRMTIGGRIRHLQGLKPLILLARARVPFADWRDCFRLWIVATEEPFRSFVLDWLYPEHETGR